MFNVLRKTGIVFSLKVYRYKLLVMPSPWLISANSALRSSIDMLEKSMSGNTGGGGGMPPGGGGGGAPAPLPDDGIKICNLKRVVCKTPVYMKLKTCVTLIMSLQTFPFVQKRSCYFTNIRQNFS